MIIALVIQKNELQGTLKPLLAMYSVHINGGDYRAERTGSRHDRTNRYGRIGHRARGICSPGSKNQRIDALECHIASAARRRAEGWERLEESGGSCSKPLKK